MVTVVAFILAAGCGTSSGHRPSAVSPSATAQPSIRPTPACDRFNVSSELEAAQCLLEALSHNDRPAAERVAEPKALSHLFDVDIGPDAKVACFSNDLCQVRWTGGCSTMYITAGRTDAVFYEAVDATTGCSDGVD